MPTPRDLLLLGIGALTFPIAHIITATVLGRSWMYPKES